MGLFGATLARSCSPRYLWLVIIFLSPREKGSTHLCRLDGYTLQPQHAQRRAQRHEQEALFRLCCGDRLFGIFRKRFRWLCRLYPRGHRSETESRFFCPGFAFLFFAMVQNNTRGLAKQNKKSRPKATGPKKGKKFIAPKKATLSSWKTRKVRVLPKLRVGSSILKALLLGFNRRN
jgi:hypothetical protein